MLESEDKITALFVKLNRLTSMGKLQWNVEDAPRSLSRGTDDFIPIFMRARYKDQRFALYLQRYQSYDGERDRFYWSEREVLAIIDFDDRVLWQTSRNYSALNDLFETAQRKVSNVDELINNLLEDDDEE